MRGESCGPYRKPPAVPEILASTGDPPSGTFTDSERSMSSSPIADGDARFTYSIVPSTIRITGRATRPLNAVASELDATVPSFFASAMA